MDDPVLWLCFGLSVAAVLAVFGVLRARFPYKPRFADLTQNGRRA